MDQEDIIEILDKNPSPEAEICYRERIEKEAKTDQARADAMARWEQTEAAKKATAERLKLIGPDKLMIQTTAEWFDDWLSNCFTPHFETQEAMWAYHDLITRIKSAISCFEQAGKALV